jgi:hypothetical protein
VHRPFAMRLVDWSTASSAMSDLDLAETTADTHRGKIPLISTSALSQGKHISDHDGLFFVTPSRSKFLAFGIAATDHGRAPPMSWFLTTTDDSH